MVRESEAGRGLLKGGETVNRVKVAVIWTVERGTHSLGVVRCVSVPGLKERG